MSEYRILQDINEASRGVITEEIQASLAWAIDQLRWRRVEDELPTEDGVYQVVTVDRAMDYAHWGFNGKWDGIPRASTLIRWWRPFTMPENE